MSFRYMIVRDICRTICYTQHGFGLGQSRALDHKSHAAA